MEGTEGAGGASCLPWKPLQRPAANNVESDLTSGHVRATATALLTDYMPPTAAQGVCISRLVSTLIFWCHTDSRGALCSICTEGFPCGLEVPLCSSKSGHNRNQKGIAGISPQSFALLILFLQSNFSHPERPEKHSTNDQKRNFRSPLLRNWTILNT